MEVRETGRGCRGLVESKWVWVKKPCIGRERMREPKMGWLDETSRDRNRNNTSETWNMTKQEIKENAHHSCCARVFDLVTQDCWAPLVVIRSRKRSYKSACKGKKAQDKSCDCQRSQKCARGWTITHQIGFQCEGLHDSKKDRLRVIEITCEAR